MYIPCAHTNKDLVATTLMSKPLSINPFYLMQQTPAGAVSAITPQPCGQYHLLLQSVMPAVHKLLTPSIAPHTKSRASQT